jgi:hypothetical protein
LRDTGGFFNALYFVGLILYSQFQGSYFFASFISKLYQVEHLSDNVGNTGDISFRSSNSERRNSRVKVDDQMQSTENNNNAIVSQSMLGKILSMRNKTG